MVFQENKHYFLEKQQGFSLFLGYCPESLLKVCCKLSVKLSGGVASLTETFNANLQGWLKVSLQLSRLDCKFKETFSVALQVSLNLQSSLESLQ